MKYPLIFIGLGLSCNLPAATDLAVYPPMEDGKVEILVSSDESPVSLKRLEVSTDLEDWLTLARKYDSESWQASQPITPEVYLLADSAQIIDPTDKGISFYRLVDSTAPSYSAAERASAFLRQTTFGPKKTEIDNFIINFGSPAEGELRGPYLAWIEDQIQIEPFLHRAYYRRRSDPKYIDQSHLSDPGRNYFGEVGHDSNLGHQLTFFRNSTSYRPWTVCQLPGHGGETGSHAMDAIAARPELNSSQQFADLSLGTTSTKHAVWYQSALFAEDQLRQRMAWALCQFFVVGEESSNGNSTTERWCTYYDIFVRHAFGNFRDILTEVTWSPHMGYYLSSINNQKANAQRGTFPDENYAREVMQLFTIGLWELHPDGRLKLDAEGKSIPTYDNDDITEFAKIFTGMAIANTRANIETQGGNYMDPMRMISSRHDFSQKVLLDGSPHGPFPQTTEGATQDIEGFLDFLFAHPNVPPFFAHFLIQRFTISNPSPQYIEDVATAFATGLFDGEGSGERGDLEAALKAVLLHPEARSSSLSFDPDHGKLREPLIRFLHLGRAMHLYSTQTYGRIALQNLDQLFGQGPYQAPTVFNFYRPDFKPNGIIGDRGLSAPEFEINNDVTGLNLPNAIHNLVYNGLRGGVNNAEIIAKSFSQGELDFTETLALANDPSSLIDFLDLVFCSGRMSEANRTILVNELNGMPSADEDDLLERVQRAMSLLALIPEFNTLF